MKYWQFPFKYSLFLFAKQVDFPTLSVIRYPNISVRINFYFSQPEPYDFSHSAI
jgi:hypothetical protein